MLSAIRLLTVVPTTPVSSRSGVNMSRTAGGNHPPRQGPGTTMEYFAHHSKKDGLQISTTVVIVVVFLIGVLMSANKHQTLTCPSPQSNAQTTKPGTSKHQIHGKVNINREKERGQLRAPPTRWFAVLNKGGVAPIFEAPHALGALYSQGMETHSTNKMWIYTYCS